MVAERRVESLKTKHVHLETELETEIERPAPDEIRVKALKSQKLRIKDELAALDAL
ncbi:MAG: DUF465 domain-containing protein [Proteobacteria bacterium]|nr:DUF465 domain-containing protein [Pseudomonadota bacterium]